MNSGCICWEYSGCTPDPEPLAPTLRVKVVLAALLVPLELVVPP